MGEFYHMSGIPNELKGIGLGYLIYEEFINFLGFASSGSHATSEAINIWKKLYNDPEFYGVVISLNDNKKGGILLFHENYNGDVENIAFEFIKNYIFEIIQYRENLNPIKIDDKLISYPKILELKKDIEKMLQMTNYDELIKYYNSKYHKS
jgi:hypothetical protein